MTKHVEWNGPTRYIKITLPKMMKRGYLTLNEGKQHSRIIFKKATAVGIRSVLNTYELDNCIGIKLILSPNESVMTIRYIAGLLATYIYNIEDSSLLRKLIKIDHPNHVVVRRAENAIFSAWKGLKDTESLGSVQVDNYLRSLR